VRLLGPLDHSFSTEVRVPGLLRSIGLVGFSAVLAACGGGSETRGAAPTASAELLDASGRDVGMARLTEDGAGLRLLVEMHGVPAGAKGVHIHETGECEPPDFKSAGGHFNPEGKQHGEKNPRGPHAGDFPNIEIKQDGTGRLDATSNRLTLGEGPTSLFDADGSALLVHAEPDDYRTDPSGNSGDRIACGVIAKG
jgi:Cu-Zn family superoxide dismutase